MCRYPEAAEIARACQTFHAVKEFVLAVVTAVGVVCNVEWIVKFTCLNKLMADSAGAHEIIGLLAVMT